jgi:hypothetical protein
MAPQRLSDAERARLAEAWERLTPEQGTRFLSIMFPDIAVGLTLWTVWYGWLGVTAVRVVRRRRLGAFRAIEEGISLPGLYGVAVIELGLWRFHRRMRRLSDSLQSTAESGDS